MTEVVHSFTISHTGVSKDEMREFTNLLENPLADDYVIEITQFDNTMFKLVLTA
jgi:hypothetical protein